MNKNIDETLVFRSRGNSVGKTLARHPHFRFQFQGYSNRVVRKTRRWNFGRKVNNFIRPELQSRGFSQSLIPRLAAPKSQNFIGIENLIIA